MFRHMNLSVDPEQSTLQAMSWPRMTECDLMMSAGQLGKKGGCQAEW